MWDISAVTGSSVLPRGFEICFPISYLKWNIYVAISFTFITNNIFYSFVFKWGERRHIWCLYCLFPQSAVYQVVRFSFSKLTERKNFSVPVLYLYQYTLNLTSGLIALVYYNGFRSGNRESHHFSWSVKIWFKIYLSGEGIFVIVFVFLLQIENLSCHMIWLTFPTENYLISFNMNIQMHERLNYFPTRESIPFTKMSFLNN